MAYIEDLVQEIYTNCHTEGIDKLNQGLQDAIWYSGELEKNLADLNNITKQNMDFQARAYDVQNSVFLGKKQQIKLDELQANVRLRYLEKEENYQRRKEKREEREISTMRKRNALQGFFMKALGAYFSINTVKNIIQTGSKLQLLRQSIVGLTKDVQDWEYIQKISHETGNSLEVVARGYKNFYAAANMAGFSKKGIQSMYSDMVVATRAIGASSQQTEGALLALEQMISKGTVSMEELRRQLGNAVPGAFEIGAKAMNMTTQEFNNFVKKGQLASSVFVPRFIAEFKRQYIGGFKEISETFDFAMGQLKNSWQKLQLEIMSGEIGKELTHIIKSLDRLINSQGFKDFIKITVKIIAFVIDNLPLVIALLGLGGLFKVIKMNALMMRLLNMEAKRGIALSILWGQRSVQAFAAGEGAMLACYGKAAILIVALMTIADLAKGILHIFGLYDGKSLTGELYDTVTGKKYEPTAPGGNLKYKLPKNTDPRQAYNDYMNEQITRFEKERDAAKKRRAELRHEAWRTNIFAIRKRAEMSGEYLFQGHEMKAAKKQLEFLKEEQRNFNYTLTVIDQSQAPNGIKTEMVTRELLNFLNSQNANQNWGNLNHYRNPGFISSGGNK